MDSHIIIREYCPTDRNDVMNLIRLNIPKYFAVKEEADLGRYLDEEVELYYVLLFAGMIVGCGGINFADNMTTGKISWDIVHPAYQGKSLGTKLLNHRIEKLRNISSIKKIIVRTSQLVYKFYEKQGFVLLEVCLLYTSDAADEL
mgnify:FL=1